MPQKTIKALWQLLLAITVLSVVMAWAGVFDAPIKSVRAEATPAASMGAAPSDDRHWALGLGLLALGFSVNARRRR